MSDFERRIELEEAYKEMHGIKPEVYRKNISRNEYIIKLIFNNKEATLKEIMDKGLTKSVELNLGGTITAEKSMYIAENKADMYLRG